MYQSATGGRTRRTARNRLPNGSGCVHGSRGAAATRVRAERARSRSTRRLGWSLRDLDRPDAEQVQPTPPTAHENSCSSACCPCPSARVGTRDGRIRRWRTRRERPEAHPRRIIEWSAGAASRRWPGALALGDRLVARARWRRHAGAAAAVARGSVDFVRPRSVLRAGASHPGAPHHSPASHPVGGQGGRRASAAHVGAHGESGEASRTERSRLLRVEILFAARATWDR